jgi:alkylation response protein AidB-like acyl-CoA dehydrogenase
MTEGAQAREQSAKLGGEEFRAKARSWLAANALRADAEEVRLDKRAVYDPTRLAEGFDFHHRLWQAGLAGIAVPTEYAGQGLPLSYEKIWQEEVAPYSLPPHGSGAALKIAMPMLLVHGSEFLKRELIPMILRAEVSWCQFLSEPGGGSDLAGLRTTAVRDGDDWLINGSKIWTSGAHFSQYAMCLARTDPDVPKHKGLTMFVVMIPSEGLDIRPIRQINGSSEFNQEFLDNVRVPAEYVIGEVNEGWRVAQTMLNFERQMIGGGSMTGGTLNAPPPTDLVALARERGLAQDGYARQLVADVWIRTVVAAEAATRMGAALGKGQVSPQIGSALKLIANEVTYHRAEATAELAGPGGVAWSRQDPVAGEWAKASVMSRGAGIGGGTDEIQKNVVGERIIGLPREPLDDRDRPFREVPFSRR